MAIRFLCFSCEAKIKVPDGTEGRKVKCPACGALQRVPAGGEAAPEPISQPAPQTQQALKPSSDEAVLPPDAPQAKAAGDDSSAARQVAKSSHKTRHRQAASEEARVKPHAAAPAVRPVAPEPSVADEDEHGAGNESSDAPEAGVGSNDPADALAALAASVGGGGPVADESTWEESADERERSDDESSNDDADDVEDEGAETDGAAGTYEPAASSHVVTSVSASGVEPVLVDDAGPGPVEVAAPEPVEVTAAAYTPEPASVSSDAVAPEDGDVPEDDEASAEGNTSRLALSASDDEARDGRDAVGEDAEAAEARSAGPTTEPTGPTDDVAAAVARSSSEPSSESPALPWQEVDDGGDASALSADDEDDRSGDVSMSFVGDATANDADGDGRIAMQSGDSVGGSFESVSGEAGAVAGDGLSVRPGSPADGQGNDGQHGFPAEAGTGTSMGAADAPPPLETRPDKPVAPRAIPLGHASHAGGFRSTLARPQPVPSVPAAATPGRQKVNEGLAEAAWATEASSSSADGDASSSAAGDEAVPYVADDESSLSSNESVEDSLGGRAAMAVVGAGVAGTTAGGVAGQARGRAAAGIAAGTAGSTVPATVSALATPVQPRGLYWPLQMMVMLLRGVAVLLLLLAIAQGLSWQRGAIYEATQERGYMLIYLLQVGLPLALSVIAFGVAQGVAGVRELLRR